MIPNNNSQTAVFTAAQEGDYPLEWLDSLVNVSLQPEKLNDTPVLNDDLETIIARLQEEDVKLQLLIKKQVFSLINDRDVEKLIRRYHDSLIVLINQTMQNQERLKKGKKLALKLYAAIIECLDRLVTFVETRFSSFLSPEDPVTPTILLEKKEFIQHRLKNIRKKITFHEQPSGITQLVLNRMQRFVDKEELWRQMTFRVLQYSEDLIQGLETMVWEPAPEEGYSSIDKLLIYLNFNSKHYIRKLTKYLAKKVANTDSDEAGLEKLHFYYKAFKQLQRKPDRIFNPDDPNLEDVIENWFLQEINYYEKKLALLPKLESIPAPLDEQLPQEQVNEKLQCNLSVDQIGLILRAADEARIVEAPSLTEVFRKVVPFISTPRKSDLSFNSVRSKSYNAEDPDKQGAIHALQRMIDRIQRF